MTNPNPVELAGTAARRPRLLLVDDHEVGRKSLARLLGVLGYEITAVKDGESAIDAMEREPSFDYVPDRPPACPTSTAARSSRPRIACSTPRGSP